jgi:ubiquitin C-terminal hydrolase
MKGLTNFGNTCYLNSSIQTISNIYPLTKYLINNKEEIVKTLLLNAHKIYKSGIIKENMNISNSIKSIIANENYKPSDFTIDEANIFLKCTMTFQLVKILTELWTPSNETILRPVSFFQVFKLVRDKFFGNNEQHDAEESFNCIMQQVQIELSTTVTQVVNNIRSLDVYLKRRKSILDECANNKPLLINKISELNNEMPLEYLNKVAIQEIWKEMKDSYSLPKYLFSGFMHETISCPDQKCSYIRNKFSTHQHILLNIPNASMNNLDKCFEEYFKDEILSESDKWRCEKCGKLVRAKLSKEIWSPPIILVVQIKRFSYVSDFKDIRLVSYNNDNLNLSKYVSDKKLDQAKSSNYILQSIICHSGRTKNSGHYYTYSKNSENVWCEFNDETIRKIPNASILTSDAYILTYIRADQFTN